MTDPPQPTTTGASRTSGADRRRPVLAVTLLVLGALPTVLGAALLTEALTSPPNLATGIVQAAATVVGVLGLLLLALAAGPMRDTYRHGGRTTLLVTVAALATGVTAGLVA